LICVVYGTTGELIKLWPVLRGIHERGGRFINTTTAQQVAQIPGLLTQLELPQPDVYFARGRDGRELHTNRDIPPWLAAVARGFAQNRRRLRRDLRADGAPPLVLVHGDTMTTVLGTLIGRGLGAPVAHVEAGVRTWDLRHPFPEELNRRVVTRIAKLHYAPGAEAAANVRRGTVVDTGMNTIRDSLELAGAEVEVPLEVAGQPFGIVSLHRYELLNDGVLLRSTLEALAKHSARRPMLFVEHPVTVAAMRRFGLLGVFDGTSVVPMARRSFFEFIGLLRLADFAVTDSGGTQVESYVLDKPCLVHRKKVEQPDGVGENVVVSGFELPRLAQFLDDPAAHRRRTPSPQVSPSAIILDDLEARGYLRASPQTKPPR
jgi:UDP-N-acetylglucosamine 2-epimerase (non-hydrolysing)